MLREQEAHRRGGTSSPQCECDGEDVSVSAEVKTRLRQLLSASEQRQVAGGRGAAADEDGKHHRVGHGGRV